jgi:hypothetical protein
LLDTENFTLHATPLLSTGEVVLTLRTLTLSFAVRINRAFTMMVRILRKIKLKPMKRAHCMGNWAPHEFRLPNGVVFKLYSEARTVASAR